MARIIKISTSMLVKRLKIYLYEINLILILSLIIRGLPFIAHDNCSCCKNSKFPLAFYLKPFVLSEK